MYLLNLYKLLTCQDMSSDGKTLPLKEILRTIYGFSRLDESEKEVEQLVAEGYGDPTFLWERFERYQEQILKSFSSHIEMLVKYTRTEIRTYIFNVIGGKEAKNVLKTIKDHCSSSVWDHVK